MEIPNPKYKIGEGIIFRRGFQILYKLIKMAEFDNESKMWKYDVGCSWNIDEEDIIKKI